MTEIGLDVPRSGVAATLDEALELVEDDRLSRRSSARRSRWAASAAASPTTSKSSARLAERGLELSPVHEILVEESVIGWKEFELEVMRDVADNFVVICSIENIDPMGVHTGDSITVAPALTLTDKEYQRMRDAARRIIRRVGVETGGSNIQFAVNPADGRMVVIEMNPRVSRSSALASKATGFPIAKIAAKLALGYHLDEIPNDITRADAGVLRADHRLRRRQDPALELREVPAGRSHADHADEVGRRGDGHRPDLQGSVPEGHPLARAGEERAAVLRADADADRRQSDEDDSRRCGKTSCVGRGSERSADVGALPRPASRLERRAAARPDQDRSVVPASSSPRSCELRRDGRAAGVPRVSSRPTAHAEARRVRRRRDRRRLRRAEAAVR